MFSRCEHAAVRLHAETLPTGAPGRGEDPSGLQVLLTALQGPIKRLVQPHPAPALRGGPPLPHHVHQPAEHVWRGRYGICAALWLGITKLFSICSMLVCTSCSSRQGQSWLIGSTKLSVYRNICHIEALTNGGGNRSMWGRPN